MINRNSIHESTVLTFSDFESFFSLFQKAYFSDNQDMLFQLEKSSPDFFQKAYIQVLPVIPDFNCSSGASPILSSRTCNTLPCIFNMLFYLTGSHSASKGFLPQLFARTKYSRQTDLETGRTEYYFAPSSLWKDFFFSEPVLIQKLHEKRIRDFSELTERTREFYEHTPFDYYPPQDFI